MCIPLRFGNKLIETWATKESCSLEYLWPRTLGKAAISLGVRGAEGISLDLGLSIIHGPGFILAPRMIFATLVIIACLSRASDPTAWRLPRKLVAEVTALDHLDVVSEPGKNCSAALHKVRWRSPGAPISLAVYEVKAKMVQVTSTFSWPKAMLLSWSRGIQIFLNAIAFGTNLRL